MGKMALKAQKALTLGKCLEIIALMFMNVHGKARKFIAMGGDINTA